MDSRSLCLSRPPLVSPFDPLAAQGQIRGLEAQLRTLQARLEQVTRRREEIVVLMTQQQQSAIDMTQPSAAAQRTRSLQQSLHHQSQAVAALEHTLNAALRCPPRPFPLRLAL